MFPPSVPTISEGGGEAHVPGQWHDTVITWALGRMCPCWGLLCPRLGGRGILGTVLHSSLPYHTTTAVSVDIISNILHILGYKSRKICYYFSLICSMIVVNTDEYGPLLPELRCRQYFYFCIQCTHLSDLVWISIV